MRVSRVLWFEPVFFLFFGGMHISRIWGLFDRQAYANAWLGLMVGRGVAYYALMSVMALLCITGIVTFVAQRGHNEWWRWVYVFGGGYVLFDLFAIATRLPFWERALLLMFDVSNAFWNPIWIFFILVGVFFFALGVAVCVRLARQKKSG